MWEQALTQDKQLCAEVLLQDREEKKQQLPGPPGTKVMGSSGPSSLDLGNLAA